MKIRLRCTGISIDIFTNGDPAAYFVLPHKRPQSPPGQMPGNDLFRFPLESIEQARALEIGEIYEFTLNPQAIRSVK